LSWPGGSGRLELPGELRWSLHCGESNPPLGWYSRSFGTKAPAYTLLGTGNLPNGSQLVTRLQIS
jgi:hypothetical protein